MARVFKADKAELEITPEMIEAGGAFMLRHALELPWEALCPARQSALLGGIYSAMCAASGRAQPD